MSAIIKARDRLYSICDQAIGATTRFFGYQPIIVWGETSQKKRPAPDRHWFVVRMIPSRVRQVAMGTPRRYRWEGSTQIEAYSPTAGGVSSKTELVVDTIANTFFNQHSFPGLKINSVVPNETASTITGFGRTDIVVSLQYDYYYEAAQAA